MANNVVKISALQACTAPKSTDLVLVLSSNATSNTYENKKSSLAQVHANVQATKLSVTIGATPANSTPTANMSVGQIWSDGTYGYWVVSNTEIKRWSISTW